MASLISQQTITKVKIKALDKCTDVFKVNKTDIRTTQIDIF